MNRNFSTPYTFIQKMSPEFFLHGNTRTAWQKLGEGKPLLILHGWGSSSAVMLPLAKSLMDIRTCYLIDFPGFGLSPEPDAPWGVDDYADLTQEFIRNRIPGEKTDLLVHSYGARVALKLLTRKDISDKIDKVIITGGAGLKPKRKFSYYIRKYLAKALKAPFLLLPGKYKEKGLNSLRKTALWKKLGSSDYRQLSGVMRETFVRSVTEYLDDLLPLIDHEILLIWGKNDAATPLEQGKRMDKGLKESALITIDNASHYAFLDYPGQFTSISRAYLEPG
jgi:pimeloyl-ACP methyl ester carboxylesterase